MNLRWSSPTRHRARCMRYVVCQVVARNFPRLCVPVEVFVKLGAPGIARVAKMTDALVHAIKDQRPAIVPRHHAAEVAVDKRAEVAERRLHFFGGADCFRKALPTRSATSSGSGVSLALAKRGKTRATALELSAHTRNLSRVIAFLCRLHGRLPYHGYQVGYHVVPCDCISTSTILLGPYHGPYWYSLHEIRNPTMLVRVSG